MKFSNKELLVAITAMEYALQLHIIDPRMGKKMLVRLEACRFFREKKSKKQVENIEEGKEDRKK